MTKALIDRIEENIMADPNSGCWLWTAGLNRGGYGVIRVNGMGRGMSYAHRISYEAHKGSIPDGAQLDHLCRTRSCVNPNHLEPVTARENIIRGEGPALLKARRNAAFGEKTHCPYGHEYTESNSRVRTDVNGWRHRSCRACDRIGRN